MNKRLLLLGIGVAIIAGYLGFYLQTHTDQSSMPQTMLLPGTSLIGQTRPDFSLRDIEGVLRHVNEWNEKVLVINFWATWCPPCRKEMPMFAELQSQYSDQGLQFVGIAIEETEPVLAFIEKLGINYPILTGTKSAIEIAEQYGNQSGALPYTVVIDRQQKIVYTKAGPLHREEAEAVIGGIL